MTTFLKNEFSLDEFVNIIRAMEAHHLIAQFYRPASNKMAYIQLPAEVSKSFITLEKNYEDITVSKAFLTDFIKALVENADKDADKELATIESRQAKFLLCFLLSNNLAISIEGESFSFNHFTKNEKLLDVATDPEKWLKEYYPELLTSLESFWKAQVRDISFQRTDKEEMTKFRKKHEDAMQKDKTDKLVKYLAFRSEHSFDYVQLNMEILSYAIEGLILQGKIQGFSNKTCAFRPMLSQETSLILNHFNDLTRYKGLYVVTQEEILEAFVQLMNSLIHFSKDPNDFQLASQQLLGFMLFHNFEIQHQNQNFRISDLLSLWDINMQVSEDWLNQQAYPSKVELENLINIDQNQKKSFLPLYAQQSKHTMQVELDKSDLMDIEEKKDLQILFKP